MIKKIKLLSIILLMLFIFSSCIYIISEKPYYYDYTDYEDPETSVSYNYYYYSYSGYPVYVPTYTPTPVPTPIIIKSTDINIIVLKVVENKHIFYRNNKEIAVWYFHPDGRIDRNGEVINGRVIRYYDDSNIIEWEFEYKNNVRWGQCRRYYNNGKLWEEVYYNNGKREGTYRLYYPDGRIKEEVKYKDGFRDGIYKIYHEDGRVIEHGNYKKNNREVKFRDEKYFKEIMDKKEELIFQSTQQINIILTPVRQINEQPTFTVDNELFKDREFLNKKKTRSLNDENNDKDKIKNKDIMVEQDKNQIQEQEKNQEQQLIQQINQEQKQEIIEHKVDASQTTLNEQTKSGIINIKKPKDRRKFKIKYDFGQEKKLDEWVNFKATVDIKDSVNESQLIAEEINTENSKSDKELKEYINVQENSTNTHINIRKNDKK
ncbi:MAG: hypothetical protein N2114_03120 [Candidatus Goldbacteria bacterium]|nr:hypothetical protein [Candidatus Goldiibacteriota bacterium]